MENITSGLQAILQILPLGDWLTVSPYGIVYGTLLFDVFSCVILLLSKLIFKDYFSNTTRKRFVLAFVAGTAFLVSACYMFVTVRIVPTIYTESWDMNFSYLLPIYYALILIAYGFFVCYLVGFIIRLLRRGKKKKGGDIAAE